MKTLFFCLIGLIVLVFVSRVHAEGACPGGNCPKQSGDAKASQPQGAKPEDAKAQKKLAASPNRNVDPTKGDKDSKPVTEDEKKADKTIRDFLKDVVKNGQEEKGLVPDAAANARTEKLAQEMFKNWKASPFDAGNQQVLGAQAVKAATALAAGGGGGGGGRGMGRRGV